MTIVTSFCTRCRTQLARCPSLPMNRRIEHRDLEDTEPEDLPALCVLPISALRQGSASHTPRFMAAMRVQSWRSRLSMNRRIEHRDLEDTEPEELPELRVLPISALRHGSASHTARFMAAMRVQSWRSRLPMSRLAPSRRRSRSSGAGARTLAPPNVANRSTTGQVCRCTTPADARGGMAAA